MRGTLRRRAFYHWLVPPALGVEVDNASRVQRGFRIFLPCALGARRLRTPLPVSFFFPSPFPPVLQGNKWLCVPLRALQPSTETPLRPPGVERPRQPPGSEDGARRGPSASVTWLHAGATGGGFAGFPGRGRAGPARGLRVVRAP